MGTEKNQLLFIGAVLTLLAVPVILFLLVGGEFGFLFIQFSAEGVFGEFLWATPIIMITAQQLYVIPSFVRAYWDIFSDTPPLKQEIYLPVLNENVVLQSDILTKVTYSLWAIICIIILIMLTPFLTFFGTGEVTITLTYLAGMLVLACFLAISFIRGIRYLAIRREIYDYHNKYLGIRGTTPFFWFYKILYFVPLGRSLSLLVDLQVMHKLSKFNDVEKMKTDLYEE